MQVGSLVECVANFDILREEFKIDYPKQKELLIVSNISPHTNPEVSAMGIVLLHFEEYPDIPGLCDRTVDGQDNFVELQPPADKLIEEINSITNPLPETMFY